MNDVSAAWSDLPLPMWLPELVVTPDAMQIFMFSAVTWNRHHIHYSRDAAVREGLPDVVVQRALLGNYFARMLSQWIGSAGHIGELSWQVRRSAFPGQPLRVRGLVDDREQRDGQWCLRCTLTIVNPAGEEVASGQALLVPGIAALPLAA